MNLAHEKQYTLTAMNCRSGSWIVRRGQAAKPAAECPCWVAKFSVAMCCYCLRRGLDWSREVAVAQELF